MGHAQTELVATSGISIIMVFFTEMADFSWVIRYFISTKWTTEIAIVLTKILQYTQTHAQ